MEGSPLEKSSSKTFYSTTVLGERLINRAGGKNKGKMSELYTYCVLEFILRAGERIKKQITDEIFYHKAGRILLNAIK